MLNMSPTFSVSDLRKYHPLEAEDNQLRSIALGERLPDAEHLLVNGHMNHSPLQAQHWLNKAWVCVFNLCTPTGLQGSECVCKSALCAWYCASEPMLEFVCSICVHPMDSKDRSARANTRYVRAIARVRLHKEMHVVHLPRQTLVGSGWIWPDFN